MDKNALSQSPEALRSFRYPRFYAPSTDRKIFFLILSILLLASPFISSDKDARLFFLGFVVLVNMAYLAYAFGSKITLHADKIEYQSCFFFKRLILRDQIVIWQLHITETRIPLFLLILKSRQKDLVIEMNFKIDPAFYAWFPNLQTLVQERWMQFPGLRDISK